MRLKPEAGVEEAWESDPTAIAATYEHKKSSEFEVGFNRPLSPRVLRGQKVFSKSFCRSQLPHKYVNLFFISVRIYERLTGLCGN